MRTSLLRRWHAERDESGAIAIMVAALMVVLLSVAALVVDLGNAMNREQLTQNSADFAALSGAGSLPDTGVLTVQQVADSLNENQPASDGSDDCNPDSDAPITPAMLTDLDDVNGEVSFPAGTSQMRVLAPAARVQFGLARVMGFENACVQGEATVMVGTPGAATVFPSFATDGCDWGQRTIFAPASSTTGPSFEPDLRDEFDAHRNITSFDMSGENPSPDSVPVAPAATTVTLRGTQLDTVTKVGFFQEDTEVYQEVSKPSFDSQSGAAITLTLPDDLPTLTTAPGLWWVRVYAPERNPSDTTMKWSAIKTSGTLSTVPFEVGESYLRCAGVAAGSFGDILLPRSQPAGISSADWLAMNIATNLQTGPPRLSLTTYPGAPTSVYGASSAPNLCSTSDPRTVYSSVTGTPDIKQGTNCVDNGTGLTANAATDGLISGVRIGSTTYPGRLDTGADTACATRVPATVTGPSATSTKLINNDVLTCFIEPGTTVGQIASRSYGGGPVLDCAIYDSPRFFYQPIVQVRPSGGSSHYSIVDFRPAFVSEQAPTATRGAGAIGSNGVTIARGQVTQLDVIFFHPAALSADCANGFGATLGGTTQTAVRLVD